MFKNIDIPARLLRGLIITLSTTAVMIMATMLFLFTRLNSVSANSGDYTTALTRYPWVAGSRIDPSTKCAFCHTSSIPSLNAYGISYKSLGRSPDAMAAIEPLDSDGDGFTNIVEIQALTFPGDPSDHPVSASATPTSMPPTATKPAPTASVTLPASTATKPAPSATSPARTATIPAPTATKPAPSATQQPPQLTATKSPTGEPTSESTVQSTPPCSVDDSSDRTSQDGRGSNAKNRPNRTSTAVRPRRTPWTTPTAASTPGCDSRDDGRNDKNTNRMGDHSSLSTPFLASLTDFFQGLFHATTW